MSRWAWCLGLGAIILAIVASGGFDASTGDPAPPAKPSANPPDRLKILTYNTWGCRNGVEKMIEFLRQQDADVICLQEIHREDVPGAKTKSDQAVRIAKALGLHVVSAATLGVPAEQACDPAILSRFDLTDGAAHALNTGGWCFAVSAQVKAKGRRLNLVSVHTHSTFSLRPKHLIESTETRMAEIEGIRAIVEKLEGDVIVAGDFNAMPLMPEYLLLTRDLRDYGSASKEDELSFPASKPTVRIDYVFGRGEFAAASYQVMGGRLSDHLPVLAVLQRGEALPSTRQAETRRADERE